MFNHKIPDKLVETENQNPGQRFWISNLNYFKLVRLGIILLSGGWPRGVGTQNYEKTASVWEKGITCAETERSLQGNIWLLLYQITNYY